MGRINLHGCLWIGMNGMPRVVDTVLKPYDGPGFPTA